MFSIRNNVFETNSSSVHNFVISKENTISTKIKNIDMSDCDDYGWEFIKYTEPADKLCYLLTIVYYKYNQIVTSLCSEYREKNNLKIYDWQQTEGKELYITQEEKDLMLKYIQKYNSIIDRIKNLINSKNVKVKFSQIGIKKFTDDDIAKNDITYIDYCRLPDFNINIDHAPDAYEFYNFIMESDKNILNWIFGKSFFCAGNDNCDDKEIKWLHNALKVKFPHDHYVKGN